jgi:outer membrane lipoprotein carrier protein
MPKKLGLIIVLALVGANVAWSLTAEEVFEKVRTRYAKYAGIRAEFTQTSVDQVTGTAKRSGGTLILGRPDKLRMEVSTPKKQLLVSDGAVLFVYEEGSKQATKQELGQDSKQTPLEDLLFGHENAFTVEYDLKDTSETAGGHAIKLIPKEGRAPFKSTDLWINPKTFACEKVEYTDLSEDRNTFELTNEKGLKKVDAKWFTFRPPAGVAVVEAR